MGAVKAVCLGFLGPAKAYKYLIESPEMISWVQFDPQWQDYLAAVAGGARYQREGPLDKARMLIKRAEIEASFPDCPRETIAQYMDEIGRIARSNPDLYAQIKKETLEMIERSKRK